MKDVFCKFFYAGRRNLWKKLTSFFVIFLFLASCLFIVSNDVDVVADYGGDGGGDDGSIGLDCWYMWNVTQNLSNVVHLDDIWENGIRKGRAFGTEGDRWTAEYIKREFENMSLENVDKIPIQNIDGKDEWRYNYKVVTIEYNLTINGDNYPYNHIVPLNETGILPSGAINNKPLSQNKSKMDYIHSFNNIKIIPKDLTIPYNFSELIIDLYTELHLIFRNKYILIIL